MTLQTVIKEEDQQRVEMSHEQFFTLALQAKTHSKYKGLNTKRSGVDVAFQVQFPGDDMDETIQQLDGKTFDATRAADGKTWNIAPLKQEKGLALLAMIREAVKQQQ